MNIRNSLKISTTALALLGSVAIAHAADLAVAPVEPAAPIPYAFNWTGFYVGANVGYGFGGDDKVGETSNLTGFIGNFGKVEPNGAFGGGQAGYNYQWGSVVLGLEGDIQGAGISDTKDATLGTITARTKSEINWFGTVRPRIGWAWDRALIYATGGVAFGGIDYSHVGDNGFGLTVDAKKDDTRVGWAAGAGIEYAFYDNWSAKLEYQYVNFGKYNVTGNVLDSTGTPTGETITTKATPDFHTVRAGINYKF